jgi:hypothetical protein
MRRPTSWDQLVDKELGLIAVISRLLYSLVTASLPILKSLLHSYSTFPRSVAPLRRVGQLIEERDKVRHSRRYPPILSITLLRTLDLTAFC